jgi:hypothetical protein
MTETQKLLFNRDIQDIQDKNEFVVKLKQVESRRK